MSLDNSLSIISARYRQRKLFTSSVRRAIRWEFWPMWLFYIPVVFYIILLVVRYRGLSFLSCNPRLPLSGVIGEHKADILQVLQDNKNQYVAQFELLLILNTVEERIKQAKQFMQSRKLSYPVVLKPDFGQRGLGVKIVRSSDQLSDYLAQASGDVLIQQYIDGEEFGVFYLRLPEAANGKVFSITEKHFPTLYGDGTSTLEQLILEHPRTHFMAKYLLELHQHQLSDVLVKGQMFKTVEIGSHCRGALFLDGNRHITPPLEKIMDEISQTIPDFYFGRYDIRCDSVADLEQGIGLKVLEVNGVTSESTNIYDPKHSVWYAYKVLFQQWHYAFKIGKQNISAGHNKISLFGFLNHLKHIYI